MQDLVGLPYAFGGTDPATGVDCLWAVRQALQRIFPDLTPEECPLEHEAGLALARGCPRPWKLVSWPSKLGDVLFGEHPEPWVAVLVDVEGRNVFTAPPTRGTAVLNLRALGPHKAILRRQR